ncbi:hypothetical protein LOK49_LG09G01018 [Camellia lanceoleosa]|uniref:Uncharacterized protein n=1 Tax=Camellia lanceoleosa TaxID=1840588 RepID=A0ACC0GH16_9ERIC|nr:hypothetical protein LOK49_LG09G01018 [Camellia lanceoleosa]
MCSRVEIERGRLDDVGGPLVLSSMPFQDQELQDDNWPRNNLHQCSDIDWEIINDLRIESSSNIGLTTLLNPESLRRAYGKGDAFRIALSSFNDFCNVSVLLRNSEQKENWISTKINVEAGAVQVASIAFVVLWPCCKA